MLGGNIRRMFAIIPGVLPHVKAGKMDGLAVTALKRSPLAPDVPSVAELGLPQLESLAWIGLAAPAGLPQEVLARLNRGDGTRPAGGGDARAAWEAGLRRGGWNAPGVRPMDPR